jgi:hypothetical protein
VDRRRDQRPPGEALVDALARALQEVEHRRVAARTLGRSGAEQVLGEEAVDLGLRVHLLERGRLWRRASIKPSARPKSPRSSAALASPSAPTRTRLRCAKRAAR